MSEVVLHIYDVTNSASARTNSAITQLNKILKDGIGLGGVFHSAIQVYGEEWSFGFCENGTGVFNCPPKRNPMYTYRESIVLGHTLQSAAKVSQILRELRREWPGYSYDLLSKNCNHFCDAFCEELGVQKLPGWVNRFANAGDTAIEVAENTAVKLRQAKTDIINASKVAYRFLLGGTQSNNLQNQGTNQSARTANGNGNMFQASWLKNLSSIRSSVSSQDATSQVHTQGSGSSHQRDYKFADAV